MVLTIAQVTLFFTEGTQMDIPAATFVYIQTQGIRTPDDLKDFTDNEIDDVVRACRRPPGNLPAFEFGAQSAKRLKVACKLVRFYELIGRNLTAANIQWDPHMREFEIAMKNLEDLKSKEPTIPTLVGTSVMKWTDPFKAYLNQCVGPRMVPLSYIVRPNVAVPAACPPQAVDVPYSAEHGSVKADMIARASHTGEAYNTDNYAVYYKLVEATNGTNKSTTVLKYRASENGREAYLALISSHAGKEVWQKVIIDNEKVIRDQIWKGNSSYTLTKHCEAHRTAFEHLEHASLEVPYEVPNDHTRITYLFKSIENSDPELRAAIAAVNMDEDPDGIRYDFERCVRKITPADPVAMKRAGGKRGSAEISSAVSFSEGTKEGSSMKSGIGTTGVHLRYHVREDYLKLSTDQQDELREWRKTPEGKAASQKGSNKKNKTKGRAKSTGKGGAGGHAKMIAAAVEKTLKDREDKKSAEEAQELIVSMLTKAAITTPPGRNAAAGATASGLATMDGAKLATTLRSILGKAQNPD